MKCTQTETLLGPYQLDILDRKEDDARIVLLSDVHEYDYNPHSEQKCRQSIIPYLDNLFRNYRGKEKIDFFLEIDFEETARLFEEYQQFKDLRLSLLQGENPHQLNYLVNLRTYFNDCFKRSKGKCEFNGRPIRFHHADVRSGVLHSQTDKETETIIKEYHKSWDIAERGKVPTMRHVDTLEKLVKKYAEKNVDFFFHMSKIDKQLKKLPSEVAQALYNMMKVHMDSTGKYGEYRDVLYKKFEHLRMMLTNSEYQMGIMTVQVTPDRLRNEFNEALHYLQVLLTPLFDIYTLARIVRHDMKQVIIYAGGSHIERIREFLETYMNYRLTVGTQSGYRQQYLDMKRVPQPWFK